MSDRIISYLRTYVPKAWGVVVGALLVWLGQHAPWAIDALAFFGVDLNSTVTVLFVVGLTEAAWFYVWRRVEPHVPDWLSRLAMGSALQPAYQLGTVYPIAAYDTGNLVELVSGDVVTIGSIIMNSGAEIASYDVNYASGAQGLVHESEIVRRLRE